MKRKYEINKLPGLYFGLLVGIYDIGILIDNYKVKAGYAFYLRAIMPMFSPISCLYFLIPVIGIIISYLLISKYWFTSVKEWYLIRKRNSQNVILTQIKVLIKYDLFYTLASWLSGCVLLLLLNLIIGVRCIPSKQGITYFLGNILGVILLLILALLVNLAAMFLALIFNLIVKKAWEVLVASIVTELLLPVLLFNFGILPENLMPINVLNNVLIATQNQVGQIVITYFYMIIVLVIEIAAIFGINRYKERTCY